MTGRTKSVAVVVPMSNRSQLTTDETISFKHLRHFLGRYDKYLVVPKTLQIHFPGFDKRAFDDRFFGSVQAHRRLLFSARFYEAFRDYEFILIYHPDALVFSDQLEYWCGQDFDYIGAPWVVHKDAPYAGQSAHEGKVGNGGFALIKIESFLKVFYSTVYQVEPSQYWGLSHREKSIFERFWHLPKRFLKQFRAFNGAQWELRNYASNDDSFWANRASHYYPEFTIAPLKTALRFAFECVPRYCFQLNNFALPFGCHAWARYDREFWQPYLLK
jgi:hypothetical protein